MAELVDDMSSQPQEQRESREPENGFPHACYKIDKGLELMKDINVGEAYDCHGSTIENQSSSIY